MHNLTPIFAADSALQQPNEQIIGTNALDNAQIISAEETSALDLFHPDQIQEYAAEHLDRRPSSRLPTDRDLDQILDGKIEKTSSLCERAVLMSFDWFSGFMPWLNW